MTGDDDRMVDAVLGLLGFCDPPPTEGQLTSETRNRLLKTTAWDLAADALEADPILGPILNKWVGTSFWDEHLVLEAEVLYDLVVAAARASDPGSGVRQALGLLRDQYPTRVPVVSLAPITGIVVRTPILLDENVELRQLSDKEVGDLFLAGRYASLPLGVGLDIVYCGLVVTTHATRVVTDPGKLEPRRSIDSRDRKPRLPATPGETVLAALRLHADNPHAISLTGSMTFGPGQSRSISLIGLSRPGYVTPLLISSEVADRVRSDYPRIAKILVRSSNPVSVALRRYTTSYDRRESEDRVIDLTIALEALFADGATELTYRLSVNGANYVDVPGRSRAEIRDWLKAAYTARSKVVHGKSSTTALATRLLRDDKSGVDGLADDLAYFVRLALTTVLRQGGDNPPNPIADFGAMVLRP